jgi:hypothetical protein
MVKNMLEVLKTSVKDGKFIIKPEKPSKSIKNNKIKNRGEKNAMSITNENEVIAIRKDSDKGIPISELQIIYNKNYMFIYKIVKRLR